MFENYSQMHEWLSPFPMGYQVAEQMSLIVAPGEEVAFLFNGTSDFPINTGNFTIFTDEFVVKGWYKFDEDDASDCRSSIQVLPLSDLKGKDVIFSNPARRVNGDMFKKIDYAFEFGTIKLYLSESDYQTPKEQFQKAVQFLLKK